MDYIEKSLEEMKKVFYSESAKKKVLEDRKSNLENKLEEISTNIDTLEKVQILFQKTSEYAREQGRVAISNMTTSMLNFIFDDKYKFDIELDLKRNVASAEFYVTEEYEDRILKTKPQESRGGGIVDVIGLALRLSFLEQANPKIEGPLILDEPAKHVSSEYTDLIGEFLVKYSSSRDRQIIMITHNEHLANLSENGYRISNENGTSIADRI